MKALSITKDGDVALADGRMFLTSRSELVRQNLLKRLRTFSGEWFLNINLGVPYFQAIFVKGIDEETITGFFVQEILSTPGVLELIDFSLDIATNRELTVEFKVKTTDDDIITVEETL